MLLQKVTSLPHGGIQVGMRCHILGNSSLVSSDNFFRKFKPSRSLSLAGTVIAIFEIGISLVVSGSHTTCSTLQLVVCSYGHSLWNTGLQKPQIAS